MTTAKRRAVFLDRDGTIIQDVPYLGEPHRLRLLPGAGEALARLRAGGYALVLVSNQSGVGRGWITPEEAGLVHARLAAVLAEQGVDLDAAYYCPHAPDEGCACRKPLPGMLRRAAADLGLSLEGSVMVGDKLSDVEAGRRAGCRTILFAAAGPVSPPGDAAPDAVAADWPAVVQHILAQPGAGA